MSADGRFPRMVRLLHVLLLFVVSSEGFSHHGGHDIFQSSYSRTCETFLHCLKSWHCGESHVVANARDKAQTTQDEEQWQTSMRNPHCFDKNVLEDNRHSCVCASLLQKQLASLLTADATRLLSSYPSVSKETNLEGNLTSSLTVLKDINYNCKIFRPLDSTLSLSSLASLLRGSPRYFQPPPLYSVRRSLSFLPNLNHLSGSSNQDNTSSLQWSSSEQPRLRRGPPEAKFQNMRSHYQIDPSSSRTVLSIAIAPSAFPAGHHHPGSRRHHPPRAPSASPRLTPASPLVPRYPRAPPPFATRAHVPPSGNPAMSPVPIVHPPHGKHHHRHRHVSPIASPYARPPLSPRPPAPRHPGAPISPPAGPLPSSRPPARSHPGSSVNPPFGHRAVPPSGHAMGPAQPVASAPMALPPPPPNEDCNAIVCQNPLARTPLGSPCGCVLPIQVEIELTVPLYALFPLISVLAGEIAEGTVLSQSQVEIMGASANSQDQDKSIVDIDLVPLDEEFDNITALLIYQKFWYHEVILNVTYFGNYSVMYVQYPGLPASPPSSVINGPSGSPGVANEHPFGVDVSKKSHKLGIGTIAMIATSLAVAVVICVGAIWIVLSKYSHRVGSLANGEPGLLSARTKRSGAGSILSSDIASSTSMSFASSIATYASTARTFAFAELERATDKFNPENVVGEGGFGRVYCGVLDDGTKVAVKVLTRDDQQGGKEFIAEVEMLGRLHHRNLVKLIGICTEEHSRCLVYELIPNGSVESHLHGVDKESSPLDWDARMKIALGAARGLAYLHEDSNPRVIHRDFKASNILLENDFNPKVSDFGLAKAAPDEGSGHLSTRVMGTFGYVAPEYAMTGHLLVKSDVYSYGVVLLELLSGRKPVDMIQPPGQENLVTWARPLLASTEGLEQLVDPALGKNFPLDSMARVAAIASMCVQPEVSHRPFMGEVVQALKLVCNDSDIHNVTGSTNGSHGGDSPADSDIKAGRHWLSHKAQYVPDSTSFVSVDYDSGPSQAGETSARRPLSASALWSDSRKLIHQYSGSLRRHSLSGPLKTPKNKLAGYKGRGSEPGSTSEHALSRHLGVGLDRSFLELWP